MKNKYNLIVYIGRFQPPTLAHISIIDNALSLADNVLVLMGSAYRARTFRDPFTALERKRFFLRYYKNEKRILFEAIPNSNYDFNWWLEKVQSIVKEKFPKAEKIAVIGHEKDSSSYYLNYFPQWSFINVPELEAGLSATDIRNTFFTKGFTKKGLDNNIYQALLKWKQSNKNIYNNIKEEKKFIDKYKKSWSTAPYPPIFVTTDALVLCKGYILLIQRKNNPGKNLYAMPGGFLNQTEYLQDCVIRELIEETSIKVKSNILKNSIVLTKAFDDPYRDLRGRCITHCYVINLKNDKLPKVKANDDALAVKWVRLDWIDNNRDKFFGDHYMMIKHMLGKLQWKK